MAKKDKSDAGVDDRTMIAIGKALADPTRLGLFRRIAGGDKTSCMDLRECMDMNPATLSHHMKQLETAGLIETHRDGKLVRAELRRKVWKSYLSWLKDLA